MVKEELFKSKFFKILIPIVIVLGIIKIFEGGYYFGIWLYHLWH